MGTVTPPPHPPSAVFIKPAYSFLQGFLRSPTQISPPSPPPSQQVCVLFDMPMFSSKRLKHIKRRQRHQASVTSILVALFFFLSQPFLRAIFVHLIRKLKKKKKKTQQTDRPIDRSLFNNVSSLVLVFGDHMPLRCS